jgi:hypothetical protein
MEISIGTVGLAISCFVFTLRGDPFGKQGLHSLDSAVADCIQGARMARWSVALTSKLYSVLEFQSRLIGGLKGYGRYASQLSAFLPDVASHSRDCNEQDKQRSEKSPNEPVHELTLWIDPIKDIKAVRPVRTPSLST